LIPDQTILDDKDNSNEFNAKNYKSLVSKAFRFFKSEQSEMENQIISLRNLGKTRDYFDAIYKYKANFMPHIEIDNSDNNVTHVIFEVMEKVDINKEENNINISEEDKNV